MKQIKIFLSVAALAVVGAMMSGCAEELEALQPANKTVTMKTTVGLGQSAVTRGAIDPANGTTTFTAGDRIAVIYQNASNETVKAVSEALTAADISADGENATFSVELTAPKASGTVRYIYPAAMAAATIAADAATDASATVDNTALATQDGTLDNLANALDLALYDGTMTAEATLPTGVTLQNQLTILELKSIKDEGDNDITASIGNLTVAVGTTTTYTVSRMPAAGPIYIAMLPVATAEDITFTAEVDGIVYNKTATGKTLAKNKINPVNLSMAPDFLATPLTIEAIEAGAQVNFDINTDVATNGVQYRTFSTASGWSDWADYTDNDPVTLASIGDKVQFWGDNEKYGSSPASNIQFDKDCYAYGNIMSLIKSTDFITETTLTGSYNFYRLFYNNTHLKSHADKPLMLPATTLTERCYSQMFVGCTSLTIAPKLPAMEMKKMCYGDMFRNCTSLIAVPDLPATTLAEYCYCNMFQGCTELVTALKLPATTLAEDCYLLMFDECSKLATVPADMLPATTLAEECYLQMFVGCTSLTTAPDLPATTLAKNCYNGMFGTCESLTTAPELRATTLAEGCYSGMFSSCTSLATAPELRATTLAKDCYSSMFSYCESLTTAPELRATTLAEGCYSRMFYDCTKLSSVTCLATDISASECLAYWLTDAGTTDGCERKVYVNPSMLTVGTDNSDGQWFLATSGTDGKRWTVATNDYTHLTSTNIGHVLAADGNIYANATAATTAGTTAEAVIAYVGKVDKYFDKFLAIALEDVTAPGQMCTWATALTKANEYATNHPITIGGTTYNTSTTDTYYDKVASDQNTTSATATAKQKGWRLPSVTDWRYIFDGLGRQKAGLTLTAKDDNSGIYSSNATPTDPLGVKDGMYYYKDGDASSLLAAINAACGNTALQSSPYWSSSEYSDNSDNAWEYNFNDVQFWWVTKAGPVYVDVRAVFAY